MKKRDLVLYSAAMVISLLAGALGSLFTSPAIQGWYSLLEKPSFNPPSWVFGPVWTILFILIGLALGQVLTSRKTKYERPALIWFGIQWFLNVIWSWIFFAAHSPLYGFVEIVMLWFGILITIYYFHKIRKSAAYLLVPYLLWVSFAAFLNFVIWRLN